MERDSSVATAEAMLVILVLFAIAAAAAIGVYIGRETASSSSTTTATETTVAVDPAVAAGAHAFQSFACAQCHGMNGRGGVNPNVPALTDVGKSLSVAQMHTIINKGLGVSSDPKRPFMPVWGPLMSEQRRNQDATRSAIRPERPGVDPRIQDRNGTGDDSMTKQLAATAVAGARCSCS